MIYRSTCLIRYRGGFQREDHIEVGDVISQEDVDRHDLHNAVRHGYLVPVEPPVDTVRILSPPRPWEVKAREAKRHGSDALMEGA